MPEKMCGLPCPRQLIGVYLAFILTRFHFAESQMHSGFPLIKDTISVANILEGYVALYSCDEVAFVYCTGIG